MTLEKNNMTMSGTSLAATMVATGNAKDAEDFDLMETPGGKLSIFQAFMVAFCIAFGAGIAFVGWYPKLAGIWGFALALFVVSVSGALAENALHETAIKTQASSFAQLTESLPCWMQKVTSFSLVFWGFTIAGLYTQFIFTFLNKQVFGEMFDASGLGSTPLYVPIAVVVYFVTLPPRYAGSVVKMLTNINLVTTWVVIFFAIVKALTMIFGQKPEERPKDFIQFQPAGLMQVTVLLAGAMFQCTAVPRLQYEIKPELREKASWMIPLLLASVQGGVFLVVGWMGYWALGDQVQDSGDVFDSYQAVQPDWMVSILQGGIALLMFLSLPLLALPPKNELWAMCATVDNEGLRTPFEESPLVVQLVINAVLAAYATFMPMVLGRDMYMNLTTVVAGTAANWMNLFLPGFVILFAYILPARREELPWAGNAIKTAWIFCLATASLISSVDKTRVMIEKLAS